MDVALSRVSSQLLKGDKVKRECTSLVITRKEKEIFII